MVRSPRRLLPSGTGLSHATLRFLTRQTEVAVTGMEPTVRTLETMPAPPSPPGYEYYAEQQGPTIAAFGTVDTQLAQVFRRTGAAAAESIVVYRAVRASRDLAGTEGKSGATIVLSGGRSATYHDGMWCLGPGREERVLGGTTLVHWDLTRAHSLTVKEDDRVLAVRTPTNVALDDLISILEFFSRS